jgi:hypothetical protein
LDSDIENTTHVIREHRARRKQLAVAVLLASLVAIGAAAYGIYTYTPANITPDRIGVPRTPDVPQ